MRYSFYSIVLCMCWCAAASAQDTLKWSFTPTVFLEPYYAFDVGEPEGGERPGVLYNHKRHNEFGLNLGLIHLAASKDNVRGAIGLQVGDYVNYNLAHEPISLRNIFEANVGVRLCKDRELWIDAGVLPSHIGSESAIGSDNYTLTRSLLAENSPYYEAGARFSYQPNERLYVSILALNGFQQMRRPEGFTAMNFGTQITYTNEHNTKVNFSTYLGADSWQRSGYRLFYYDLYSMTDLSDGTGLVFGYNMGIVGDGTSLRNLGTWFGAYGIVKQRITKSWWIAGRAEIFGGDNSAQLLGGSLGVDKEINDVLLWRIEYRGLRSDEKVFIDSSGGPAILNQAFTTSLCLKIGGS